MLRLLLFLALLCVAGKARAEWLRVETRNFVIQAELPEPELRHLGKQLEMLDALLRIQARVTTAPGLRKTRIIVLEDTEAGQRATGRPWFSGGVERWTPDGALAFIVKRAPDDPDYTLPVSLFHEYAHGFMQRFLGHIQPGWFIEGFACFFQTAQKLPNGAMEVGRHPVGMETLIDPARPVNFATVMSMGGGALPTTAEGQSMYVQGWVITHHYLLGGPRAAEIGTYLDRVRKRQPVQPAALFAGGLTGFDAAMTSWYAALPPPREIALPAVDPASIAIRPMRPGEIALLELRFLHGPIDTSADDEEASIAARKAYRVRALALYDQYPDEPAIGFFVALGISGQDLGLANRIMDRLIAKDPNNPDYLSAKAIILIELAREAMASENSNPAGPMITRSRALLQRAIALDPGNPYAAVGLFQNYSADQGPTPLTRRHLVRAIELDPENTELLSTYVEYAIVNGDVRGAIAFLQPIAGAPHDTAARRFAIERIAWLRSLKR